jgi:protein phosphatase
VEPDVVLELHRHRVLPEDVVLLCSDGLTDMISDDAIETIVNRAWESGPGNPAVSLEQAAQALVDAALQAGGRDNVTVLMGTQSAT